jgi:hypothetical protein
MMNDKARAIALMMEAENSSETAISPVSKHKAMPFFLLYS